jgi:hypothetical protein
MELNNELKVNHITAWTGSYKENLYTSHLLEYKLFKAFLKYKKKKNSKNRYDFIKIKDELGIRNSIHNELKPLEVLSTGCRRASLIGVQLITLLKHEGTYKFVLFKRSDNAVERPRFYQFPPSGGFDAHEQEEQGKLSPL